MWSCAPHSRWRVHNSKTSTLLARGHIIHHPPDIIPDIINIIPRTTSTRPNTCSEYVFTGVVDTVVCVCVVIRTTKRRPLCPARVYDEGHVEKVEDSRNGKVWMWRAYSDQRGAKRWKYVGEEGMFGGESTVTFG